MIRLYKYVFCRYMRYYYSVDGEKDTAAFFGIMLMSVIDFFITGSIYIFLSEDYSLFFIKDDSFKIEIIKILPLLLFVILNYIFLIRRNNLHNVFYDVIKKFETQRKHYNLYFYGYFLGVIFIFAVSLIKLSWHFH